MGLEFEVSDVIPAPPGTVYAAWLDSGEHSRMTGSSATVSGEVGGEFEAWDGYIQGKNLELQPPGRIVQLWRTSEFADSEVDSLLEVRFEPEGEGTRVTIRHTRLPEHGLQYRQGWQDSYFTPMKSHFGSRARRPAP